MQTLPADIFSSFKSEKQTSLITCDEESEKRNHSDTTRKRIPSLFSHPLFKTHGANAQEDSKTPSSSSSLSIVHPLR